MAVWGLFVLFVYHWGFLAQGAVTAEQSFGRTGTGFWVFIIYILGGWWSQGAGRFACLSFRGGSEAVTAQQLPKSATEEQEAVVFGCYC